MLTSEEIARLIAALEALAKSQERLARATEVAIAQRESSRWLR